MSAANKLRRSILKDTAFALLPFVFFLHFTVTGTVFLIYALAIHQPPPTRYTIGAAITFGAILALLVTAHLVLYCRQRFGDGDDVERDFGSDSDDSDISVFSRTVRFLKGYERRSLAFSNFHERNSRAKDRKAAELGRAIEAGPQPETRTRKSVTAVGSLSRQEQLGISSSKEENPPVVAESQIPPAAVGYPASGRHYPDASVRPVELGGSGQKPRASNHAAQNDMTRGPNLNQSHASHMQQAPRHESVARQQQQYHHPTYGNMSSPRHGAQVQEHTIRDHDRASRFAEATANHHNLSPPSSAPFDPPQHPAPDHRLPLTTGRRSSFQDSPRANNQLRTTRTLQDPRANSQSRTTSTLQDQRGSYKPYRREEEEAS